MKHLLPFLSLALLSWQGYSQCLSPSAYAYLDVNNASVRMNLGGPSWNSLESEARYEIPAGSGINSFFAGSFWIGGKDEFGQLHMAAMQFRQSGVDYWPGPISSNGSITPNQCTDNDRIYKLNRWEVQEFRQRYGMAAYVIPPDILEWPADGNPHSLAHAGAPFKDVNNDGIYNAHDGDYPAFAFDEPVDRNYHLMGDQCLWWVENDIGNVHMASEGAAMGVELQCMAYAFSSCNPLNDQTLYRYKVINKSSYNFHDVYFGLWTDADLGYAQDDYVQCEVMRHLGFTYNGYAVDGTGGPGQYGEYPPAAGIGILEGPLADAGDGVDNNRNGTVDEVGEHLGMSKFLLGNVDVTSPIGIDFFLAPHVYLALQGIWLTDVPICYGGNGHPNTGCNGIQADFVFPGDSDPLGYGTGGIPQLPWSEQTEGNIPFDRRFIISSGPFSFDAGETDFLHYAALWARDTVTSGNPFLSAEKLFEAKDLVQEKFDTGYEDIGCCTPTARMSYQNHSRFKFLFSSIEEGNSYSWDFGDGSTWNGRFPLLHTYQDYGTFAVCLTVENDCGMSTVCETITISAPPVGVRLKRIEGSGNMGRTLEFRQGVHDTLFSTAANRIYHPEYDFNKGPVRVEVLDSTLLPASEMFIALDGVAAGSGWKMYPLGGTDTVYSATTIGVGDAQLIPQWGLLVQVKQVDNWNGDCSFVLDWGIDQSADPWLTWLEDTDYPNYSNWIRAGLQDGVDYQGDSEGCFENILSGTWAPYKLASHADSIASPTWSKFKALTDIEDLASVDIILTADQSRWTRCAVVEIADTHVPSIGNARRFDLRQSPSADKNGNPDNSGTMGMSWFPGYAVNLETGERLNMAFGENSWLQSENGADMVWNPTSTMETAMGEPILGGGHYIYVFGHNADAADAMPLYDEGQFIFDYLSDNNFLPGDPAKRRVYRDAMWVGIPMLESGHQLLESAMRIKLRVSKPYVDYECLSPIINQTHPLYSFSTEQLGTGIDEPSSTSKEKAFIVYPNPANDVLKFDVQSSTVKIHGISVVDMLGRDCFSRSSFAMTDALDVSGWPDGIYFLSLVGEEGTRYTQRFVVQH
ncbi:MAG: T9SS type A sorting domain-containing protein [Flavobacteriales bacterium]|nr:T9SS type A sorting domain-containing protein [Flavobacteriales bacterium]